MFNMHPSSFPLRGLEINVAKGSGSEEPISHLRPDSSFLSLRMIIHALWISIKGRDESPKHPVPIIYCSRLNLQRYDFSWNRTNTISLHLSDRPQRSANALAAFRTTIGIVGAAMPSKTWGTDTVAAAVAHEPRPADWILFATAVAGNCKIWHKMLFY